MTQKKFILGNTPDYVSRTAGRSILGYSSPILGLKTVDSTEKPTLLGSATFVQYGINRGLLTAQHVIHDTNYSDFNHIGLIISTNEHRFTIERQHLQIQSTIPDSLEFGPDLAFIKIPEIDASKIAARKAFWQMDANIPKVSKALSMRNYGIWMIFGCPAEYQKTEPSKSNFDQTFIPTALVAMSSKPHFQARKTYDYFEVEAYYNEDNDLPKSFGGVSGGGLWHVPLSLRNEGDETIQVHQPILMGLPFFQTGIKNGHRVIRCHGAKSIYLKMQKILEIVE